MILQALVQYYEALAEQEKIARPGWSKVKVSWALEIDGDGRLVDVLPLRHISEDGKRMLPREMELPAQVKRSSGVSANFLCDNSSYILGLDTKGKPERARECFAAACKLHLSLLDGIETSAAKALGCFFQNWSIENADNDSVFCKHKEELLSGDNITFLFDGAFIAEEPEVRAAWQQYYDDVADGEAQCCLITGRETVPEPVHPAVKNVRGAQSSGAALVSFNASAFCSYGKEQNLNAPISKYAAFAYTSALNYLLADRDHVKLIGNTTVVFWTGDAGEQYQDAFSALIDGGNDIVTENELNSLMNAIANGKQYDFEGLPLMPENEFFILGLSPNAARISVRFFFHSSFGEIVNNLRKHYEDINIVQDHRSKWNSMPLWALLRETVNLKSSDKTPLPQMAGDVMKSMISGRRYPETLMNQTILRIRAEHDITRGRAGIIKAYLIRNTENHPDRALIKEATTVSLNTENNYTPYVLGRLFAVLEAVQQIANPGINSTIKDRYFNSASATPATVFPVLMKLSNSHLRKIEGNSVYWNKQIGELTDKLGDGFPAHLSLQEQGSFILGYYHQTQERFKKKTNNKETNNNTGEN